MILNLLGLAVIAIATFHVYRTARDNGRSAVLWAFATVGAGIGLQFIIPVVAVVVLTLFYVSSSQRGPVIDPSQMDALNSWATIFGVGGVILSFVAMGLILRFVARLPEDDPAGSAPPPPPPPDFGGAG